jgi:hypothetical protein
MKSLLKTISRSAPLLLPTFVLCDATKTPIAAPTISPPALATKPATTPAISEKNELNIPKVEEKGPITGQVIAETSVETEEEEDAAWEEKKKNCSFCRHFLDSPCKVQFKGWSKCVEKCKDDDSDFVEICGSFTRDLVTCTSLNPEYFKDPGEQDDEDSEVDDPKEGLEGKVESNTSKTIEQKKNINAESKAPATKTEEK